MSDLTTGQNHILRLQVQHLRNRATILEQRVISLEQQLANEQERCRVEVRAVEVRYLNLMLAKERHWQGLVEAYTKRLEEFRATIEDRILREQSKILGWAAWKEKNDER